jgi:hypothetical protein
MAKGNGNGDDAVAAAEPAPEAAPEAPTPEAAPPAPPPSKAFKSADDIKAWVRAEVTLAAQGKSEETRKNENP